MRSDTAFFSAADIGRRFLDGLASDLLPAVAAAAVLDLEEGRAPHRRRGRGSEELLDIGQRLDLGLETLDLGLAVGDSLCDDTHIDGE